MDFWWKGNMFPSFQACQTLRQSSIKSQSEKLRESRQSIALVVIVQKPERKNVCGHTHLTASLQHTCHQNEQHLWTNTRTQLLYSCHWRLRARLCRSSTLGFAQPLSWDSPLSLLENLFSEQKAYTAQSVHKAQLRTHAWVKEMNFLISECFWGTVSLNKSLFFHTCFHTGVLFPPPNRSYFCRVRYSFLSSLVWAS